MAIVMPFVSYYLYRALSGDAPLQSLRRVVAGAIAGYVAINAAAFFTAVELGIQPIFFHDAAGRALYFPYSLSVAIPAMMIGHLTLAGLVEGLTTGLVLAWLQRANPQLLQATGSAAAGVTRWVRWAWVGLIALILLTPIGLLAPGTAWGEWSREQLARLGLGYIPTGFDKWSSLWSAPIPDYDIPALNNPTVAYILSAVFGVAVVLVVILALGWLLERIFRRTPTPAEKQG
jgi:cobalt/nickel transport system permease protein